MCIIFEIRRTTQFTFVIEKLNIQNGIKTVYFIVLWKEYITYL